MRRFWRGDAEMLGELATRVAGSADLFAAKRRPSRSVNFVTAHDGFTLADLVSYAQRHNAANGEGNRDGAGDNHSWNNAAEGPSDDAGILAARARDQRVLLANLLLARGTPMLAMGAELGRTQGGNNNAYAQDDATGWIDWQGADTALIGFVAQLAAFRRAHPALHADTFLAGAATESGIPDVVWRTVDGRPMVREDWERAATLVVVFFAHDDRVALVFSRSTAAVTIALPPPRDGFAWELTISTADARPPLRLPQPSVIAPPRSVLAIAEVATGAAPPVPAKGRATVTLARLAAAAGIAPEWWDIEGNRHAASPETTRALLAAMRLPAGTEAEARESLERFAENHQRRALPPALVVAEGAQGVLPVAVDTGRLVLEGEDGTRTPLDLGAAAEASVLCADGRSVRMRPVPLPSLPAGRWRLWPEGRPDLVCTLIVAPRTCFLPAAFAGGGRRFGLAAHLDSVRREGDQGIGDFTTLGLLGREAAQAGAAVLGLNPLHMLFPATRARASPYHPSDRRFLDPIHIDVAGEDGGLAAPAARARLAGEAGRLAALHAAPMVDYPGVWACKQAVLEAAFAAFDASDPDGAALAGFRAYSGAALAQFAAFQAIAERTPATGGAGPPACARRTPPTWRRSRRATPPGCDSMSGCNGSPTASSRKRRRRRGWRSGSIATSRSAARRTERRHGAGRRRWPSAPRWAPRPTRSRARGRSGTCPHRIRGACARTGSPGSRACSAPTCATPARSGSTTRWGSPACSGSRRAAAAQTAPMSPIRWRRCSACWRWKAGGRAVLSSARTSARCRRGSAPSSRRPTC